jgi:putative FmdB family regulatory protein
MPIFDFKCKKCSNEFEALVLKVAAVCPKCKSKSLEQLISTFRVDSPSTRRVGEKEMKGKHASARRDYAHEVAREEKEHHGH